MHSQPQWYLGSQSSLLSSPANQAYKEAIATFHLDSRKHGNLDNIQQLSSVADLEKTLNDIKLKYERQHDNNKISRWLLRFSSRVCHYGRIFDVLVQHHPEYVSLAWGAMKAIFLLVENHGKQVKTIAKGLALIADSLPRVEFSSILYPTAQMKEAVSEIYCKIVHFLLRAAAWYSQGKLRHAWGAFSHPVELCYDDLIQDVEDCAKRMDMLANAGLQAEQRDMHLKIQALGEAVQEIRGLLISQNALQTSANLDTNRRLTDLQLNQIMDFLSKANTLNPLKILQFHTFLSSRKRNRQQQTVATSDFWLDPKFSAWDDASTPALIWLKGDYKNRLNVQTFAIDMIRLLRQQQIPALWVLKSVSAQGVSAASMIDLVKGLICQALQLNVKSHTESSIALSCAQFHGADTIEEWFDILANTLGSFPLLYIVIDLHALGTSYSQDASWITHLFAMFDRHSSRGWITRLKVLLVSYGTTAGEKSEAGQNRNSIVPVRNRTARSMAPKPRSRPISQGMTMLDWSALTMGRAASRRRQLAWAR